MDNILTKDATEFLNKLHRKFEHTRYELLKKRKQQTGLPDFLKETESIRKDPSWKVSPVPKDLLERKVEITGPTDKKMLINALNSGASVYMADFEDSCAPTLKNLLEGQANLTEAIEGTLNFTSPEGKEYKLKDKRAVLVVRPRGWHLDEKHFQVDGHPISGSLFDFGLYIFRNAKRLKEKGTAPYFYLPKMESYLEARLWNDVFNFSEDELGLPRGTIKATVLIETIPAAFQMEEILYELREHSVGLNAGRWDYIFSIIKKLHRYMKEPFPDRKQITMAVPFMNAYCQLLVQTCHKRGAPAIGGMAAFIPSRKDAEVNEAALKKVREDKEREVKHGFDGTWVAHPDLVPVAREVFDKGLGEKNNQYHVLREDVKVKAEDLLNFSIPGGKITEEGFEDNIAVSLQYLESWMNGTAAVAIHNLMEDAATAEISRSQLWDWIHRGKFSAEHYLNIADKQPHQKGRKLLDKLVLGQHFEDFLTLPAYQAID